MATKKQVSTETAEAKVDERLMTAEAIRNLLDEALEAKAVTERERHVIFLLSSQLGNQTKKQVAEDLGKNEWQVYNFRRDALEGLAKFMEVGDPEDLYPMLGLRRGTRKPERHTRYWPKKTSESVEDEDIAE